jgi:hypothetical protein
MRSLDPYHQRVGYLGAIASIAYRGLDMKDAVRARLEAMLFDKVRVDSPEYCAMLEDVPVERREALASTRKDRGEDENPASILYGVDEASDWLYTSEIWLHQACMPSPLGLVPRNRIDRIIDLARWTSILTPTMELSEAGFIVQMLLVEARGAAPAPKLFNPLNPRLRIGLPLMYLRLLLGAEILWPSLVVELVERADAKRTLATRGQDSLLQAGVVRLLSELGQPSDPADILDLRDITEFRESIAAKPSTEENYLRPRLELLLDLDLIGRDSDRTRGKDAFPWVPTPRTRMLGDEWAHLTHKGNYVPEYLENAYFGSMARVYQVDAKRITDSRHVLLWASRAFTYVGREVGFTPGRTLAIMACILAFEAGEVLEVRQVFDAVYAAAKAEWGEYLRFSGGSRFDREFMIKLQPGLSDALERDIKATPEVR